jgi:hypothetical protein
MRSSISTPRKKFVTGRLFVFVDFLGELNGQSFANSFITLSCPA